VDVSHLTESASIEADLILPRPNLRLATPLTKVRIEIILEDAADSHSSRNSEKH
jgi:hypothetical protein